MKELPKITPEEARAIRKRVLQVGIEHFNATAVAYISVYSPPEKNILVLHEGEAIREECCSERICEVLAIHGPDDDLIASVAIYVAFQGFQYTLHEGAEIAVKIEREGEQVFLSASCIKSAESANEESE